MILIFHIRLNSTFLKAEKPLLGFGSEFNEISGVPAGYSVI